MQPQYYGAAAENNKPKGTGFKGKLLLIAGASVIGLFVIIILFTILGAVASGPRNEVARLAARAQQLHNLIDTNLKTVRDPNLKKASAEAKLYLSTSVQALQSAYGDKLPENIVAEEADATVATRLSDAAKAGRHDSEFLEVMEEKVTAAIELANKIKTENTGKLSQPAAAQMSTNMTSVSDQLALISL